MGTYDWGDRIVGGLMSEDTTTAKNRKSIIVQTKGTFSVYFESQYKLKTPVRGRTHTKVHKSASASALTLVHIKWDLT